MTDEALVDGQDPVQNSSAFPRGDSGGGAPERPAADRCAAEVMDAAPVVLRFIRQEMRRHGAPALSVPQFRTLTFLDREPGASLSAVAEHLGITLGTASSVADRLVQHGLVVRAAHPVERRRITLTLTAAGADILQAARQATRKRVAEVLGGLSDAQLDQAAESMALLRVAFRKATGRS